MDYAFGGGAYSQGTEGKEIVFTEEDFAYEEDKALEILREKYPEINECLTDSTGVVEIKKQPKDQFELSSGGGKVRSVIDRRMGRLI